MPVQGGFALPSSESESEAGGAAVLACAMPFLVRTKAQCTFVPKLVRTCRVRQDFVVQLVSMTRLAALAAWNPKTILFCSMRAGALILLPVVWAPYC